MLASFLFQINNSGKFNINEKILLEQEYIFPRIKKIYNSNYYFIYVAFARGDFSDYYYEDERYIFIGDYTFYNSKELYESLGLKTNCSIKIPQIIIMLFNNYDNEFIKLIEGDFSFLIFDKKNLVTNVYRDRMGVRPLFYYNEEDFIVSNELRLIYSIKKSKLSLNINKFLDQLLTISQFSDSTCYNEIKKVESSNYLVFNKDNLFTKKYWSPEIGKYLYFNEENQYFILFRENLIKSVEKRCAEGSVIASELSGGLDSSVVSSLASDISKRLNKKFVTFSNVFPENLNFITNRKDERFYIKEVVNYNNFDWIPVEIIDKGLIELVYNSVKDYGMFFSQNFAIFNRGIYDKAFNNKIEILLSGFGGDELVSSRLGIPWYELIEKNDIKKLLLILNDFPLSKKLLKITKILLKYLIFKLFNKQSVLLNINKKDLNERFSYLAINKTFIEKYDLKNRFYNFFYQKLPINIDEKQLIRLNQPYISERLEFSYTIASQYGLEYRYPLLDHNLIQLYFTFPWWIRHSVTYDRYLFRNSVKDIIPEKIRLRKDKCGLVIPEALVLFYKEKDNIRKFLLSVLSDKDINKIIDIEKMIKWLDTLKMDKILKNKMYPAFNIYLNVIIWMKYNKNVWIKYI